MGVTGNHAAKLLPASGYELGGIAAEAGSVAKYSKAGDCAVSELGKIRGYRKPRCEGKHNSRLDAAPPVILLADGAP